MLEKNYQPDGWLGFVVGAKFWIDFTNTKKYKDDVNKLTKEIGERGKFMTDIIRPVEEVDLGGKENFSLAFNIILLRTDCLKMLWCVTLKHFIAWQAEGMVF